MKIPYLKDREVELLRKAYPEGCAVVLDHIDDPYSKLKAGTCGVVMLVDDIGTIHVEWENGSTLGLIHGVDAFHKL